MHQVVVLPPEDALGDVEAFRRLHDPAFHRMPALLPLLPPFEAVRSDVLTRFDELQAPAFTARLGRPVEQGTSLWLTLVLGAEELDVVRGRVLAALLDPAAPRPATPLGVRIGHFGSAAELELARRGLAAAPELPPFTVDRVTLLLEDVRGLWHPVRERVLRRASEEPAPLGRST